MKEFFERLVAAEDFSQFKQLMLMRNTQLNLEVFGGVKAAGAYHQHHQQQDEDFQYEFADVEKQP